MEKSNICKHCKKECIELTKDGYCKECEVNEREPHKCKGCGKEITSKWDWCCSCAWLENM